MTNNKFKPTHVIYDGTRRIMVQMVDNVCYTEAEWKSQTSADWEPGPFGLPDLGLPGLILTFQGTPRGNPHKPWSPKVKHA